MQKLFSCVSGTHWEMILILGGLYGLRLSEALGLHWRNVDLDKKTLSVIEQLSFQLSVSVTEIKNGTWKAGKRTLPLTDTILPLLPYFRCRKMQQEKQKQLLIALWELYYDNDLVPANLIGCQNGEIGFLRTLASFLGTRKCSISASMIWSISQQPTCISKAAISIPLVKFLDISVWKALRFS